MNEQQIREIVRDELETILSGKKDNCSHSVSGTFQNDGSIKCDGCDKILTEEDED